MDKRLAYWLLLGFALSLAGCDGWDDFHGYGLENRRSHTLTATVRVFEGSCVVPGPAMSQASSYGEPVSRRLLAGELVSLMSLRRLSSDAYNGEFGECGAVWLSLPGLYEGVLAWDRSSFWDVEEDDPYPHSVVVEGTRDEVKLHLPAGVHELAVPR
jgi:hypothetical protein